jgi:putative lipoic acid-binding regulatory protein
MSTTPPAPSPPPPPAPLPDFSRDIPPEQSLIEYPSAFPIKVMGLQVDGFVEAVLAVARHFDPELDPATIERRPSSNGKYLGLTITVNATSRVTLDELYRTLSTHPMVKVVL